MSSVELAKKYVIDVPCKHCKGKGKCNCSSCENDRANNYMMVWGIRNPRPLPDMLEERERHSKEYWEEYEKSKKWAKSEDNCPKCGGKGTRPEIDQKKLDQEVQSGLITEHEKFAIIKELGNTFGAYYFQY
jgi:DnaJ-class molecular chaperone